MSEDRSIATLTIEKPGMLNHNTRYQVSTWLRRQADSLDKLGEKYTSSDVFTTKYLKAGA